MALVRECQAAFEAYAALNPSVIPADMAMRVAAQDDPGLLADDLAANLPLPPEEKLRVLSALSVDKRAELLLGIMKKEIDILTLEHTIERKVQEQVDQNQKEYYLREQLKAITGELGDGDNPQEEAEEYRHRVLELKLGEEAEKSLLKECDRLFKMPSGSHEATVVRNYLDTCLELPWNRRTTDKLDLDRARKILDRDHYGMEKIKERILETLAVRALAPDIRGQVLWPGGASRRGQDLYRPFHRRCHGSEVCPGIAGRCPGRGGYPGSPQNLYRGDAGADYERCSPGRCEESGNLAGRDRQNEP